jgi:hypothetical protein
MCFSKIRVLDLKKYSHDVPLLRTHHLLVQSVTAAGYVFLWEKPLINAPMGTDKTITTPAHAYSVPIILAVILPFIPNLSGHLEKQVGAKLALSLPY